MLKKLSLAAGFGAGYVLGAKAGSERYTQIESKFREVAGMPAVKSASKEPVIDVSSGSSSAVTGSTSPMAGAAASGSAPDLTRP